MQTFTPQRWQQKQSIKSIKNEWLARRLWTNTVSVALGGSGSHPLRSCRLTGGFLPWREGRWVVRTAKGTNSQAGRLPEQEKLFSTSTNDGWITPSSPSPKQRGVLRGFFFLLHLLRDRALGDALKPDFRWEQDGRSGFPIRRRVLLCCTWCSLLADPSSPLSSRWGARLEADGWFSSLLVFCSVWLWLWNNCVCASAAHMCALCCVMGDFLQVFWGFACISSGSEAQRAHGCSDDILL